VYNLHFGEFQQNVCGTASICVCVVLRGKNQSATLFRAAPAPRKWDRLWVFNTAYYIPDWNDDSTHSTCNHMERERERERLAACGAQGIGCTV